jgi:hypothetical protein
MADYERRCAEAAEDIWNRVGIPVDGDGLINVIATTLEFSGSLDIALAPSDVALAVRRMSPNSS